MLIKPHKSGLKSIIFGKVSYKLRNILEKKKHSKLAFYDKRNLISPSPVVNIIKTPSHIIRCRVKKKKIYS